MFVIFIDPNLIQHLLTCYLCIAYLTVYSLLPLGIVLKFTKLYPFKSLLLYFRFRLLSLGLNDTIEFYYFRILHHLGINNNKGNIVESGIKHHKSTLREIGIICACSDHGQSRYQI